MTIRFCSDFWPQVIIILKPWELYAFSFLIIIFLSLIIEENLNKIKFLHFSILFLSLTYIYYNYWNETIIMSHQKFISEINFNDWLNYKHIPITEHFWNITFYNNFLILFFSVIFIILFLGFCNNLLFTTNRNFEFSWLTLIFFGSSILLIFSFDLVEIFLCLECISLCSYILISFERLNKLSATAGIQYLILSSIPSALLILGIIYLYQNYGTIITNNIELFVTDSIENIKIYSVFDYESQLNISNFWLNNTNNIELINETIFNSLNNNILNIFNNTFNTLNILEQFSTIHSYVFLSTGLAILLILINLLFKLTAAPFHIWAPIVYNNGSLASVVFLAIFSKLIILTFTISLFSTTFYLLKAEWSFFLMIVSLFSMFFGMLGAFNEKFIKRFFIYSSMTDIGFMLLGLTFYASNLHKHIINYLFLYNLSAIIIWLCLLYLKNQTRFLTNLQSILINNTILNLIFSLNIFSLAGIPPFGGFFVKLDLLICLILSLNFFITLLILLITVINFFYYLRLIKIIYFEAQQSNQIFNKINNIQLLLFAFLINIICGFELYIENSFLFILERIVNTLL